jgi:tRNA (cytosine38-C5)-methyltransferase
LYTGKKGAAKIVRQDPQDRVFDTTWKEGLDDPETCLRYFSASEIARLMGFHQDFTFPETVSLKQQWKLLGNSLNVRVASKVSELGLRTAFGRLFLRK